MPTQAPLTHIPIINRERQLVRHVLREVPDDVAPRCLHGKARSKLDCIASNKRNLQESKSRVPRAHLVLHLPVLDLGALTLRKGLPLFHRRLLCRQTHIPVLGHRLPDHGGLARVGEPGPLPVVPAEAVAESTRSLTAATAAGVEQAELQARHLTGGTRASQEF